MKLTHKQISAIILGITILGCAYFHLFWVTIIGIIFMGQMLVEE